MEMCERRWIWGKDEAWGKSRRRGVFWDFKYWFKRKGDCGDGSRHKGRNGAFGVGVQ